MRIAILSHGASGGGSERVCTLIANSLVEKGYEVFFYAIHSDKREYYIDERVHYVYGDCQGKKKGIRFIKRVLKLRHFLRKEHIDALKKYFQELFYNERVQTFIFMDLTEFRMYDPYMIEFLIFLTSSLLRP